MKTGWSWLILVLCGCASVRPEHLGTVAVDIPANWSLSDPARAQASSLAQWWGRFDDPIMTSLVTQALQANTSVKSAQAALREARALRDVVAGGLLPTIDFSTSAQ